MQASFLRVHQPRRAGGSCDKRAVEVLFTVFVGSSRGDLIRPGKALSLCCTGLSCCLPPVSTWRICKRLPWRSFEGRGEEHVWHRQLPEMTVRYWGRRRIRALEVRWLPCGALRSGCL